MNTQEVGEVVSGAVLYDHMGISKQVRSLSCKLHAAIKIAGLCVQLLRFLNAAVLVLLNMLLAGFNPAHIP